MNDNLLNVIYERLGTVLQKHVFLKYRKLYAKNGRIHTDFNGSDNYADAVIFFVVGIVSASYMSNMCAYALGGSATVPSHRSLWLPST